MSDFFFGELQFQTVEGQLVTLVDRIIVLMWQDALLFLNRLSYGRQIQFTVQLQVGDLLQYLDGVVGDPFERFVDYKEKIAY